MYKEHVVDSIMQRKLKVIMSVISAPIYSHYKRSKKMTSLWATLSATKS